MAAEPGASRSSSRAAPLISDDKARFGARRWIQALLGGTRLVLPPDSQVSPLFYGYELALLGAPAALLFALTRLDPLTSPALAAEFVGAVVVLAIAAALRLASRAVRARTAASSPAVAAALASRFADEDSVDADEACSAEMCDAVLPTRGSRVAVDALAAALLAFGAVRFLERRWMAEAFAGGSLIAVSVGSWATVAVILRPLIGGTLPLDPAQYESDGGGEARSVTSRVLYCIAIFAVHFVSSERPDDERLGEASKILHIVFSLLPLLWAVAALPPFGCLLEYAAELVQTDLFGGSPCASPSRLAVSLVGSVAMSGIVAAAYSSLSPTAALFVAAAGGFLLSGDAVSELGRRALRCWKHVASPSSAVHDLRNVRSAAFPSSTASVVSLVGQWLVFGALLIIGGALHRSGPRNISQHSSFTNMHRTELWAVVLSIAWGAAALARALQRLKIARIVLLCPAAVLSSAGSSSRLRRLLASTARTLLTALFALYVLLHAAMPAEATDWERLARAVLTLRALRWVWQNPTHGALDAMLVAVIEAASAWSWFNEQQFVVRLLLAALATSRARALLERCEFAWMLLWTTLTVPKLRVGNPCALLIYVVVMAPIQLAVIVVAALLHAPLVPFLGTPVFILGFPRPRRFWARLSQSPPGDSRSEGALYAQLSAEALRALPALVRGGWGPLGDLCFGDMLLLRVELYVLLLQVVESGRGYATVCVRGLELQQTSCHAVEASRLDAVIEAETGSQRAPCVGCVPSPGSSCLHTAQLKARARMRVLSVHSTALTGVLDDHGVRAAVQSAFVAALVAEVYRRFGPALDSQGGEASFQAGSPSSQERAHLQSGRASPAAPVFHMPGQESDTDEPGANGLVIDVARPLYAPPSPVLASQQQRQQRVLPSMLDRLPVSDYELVALQDRFPIAIYEALTGRAVRPLELRWNALFRISMACYSIACASRGGSGNSLPAQGAGAARLGEPGGSVATARSERELSPAAMAALFSGTLPHTVAADYLTRAEHKDLLAAVLRAFRVAVKIAYDAYANGEVDVVCAEPAGNARAFLARLDSYSPWHLGVEDDADWARRLRDPEPLLFSIRAVDAVKGLFASRTCRLEEQDVAIVKLNGAAVRGVWASLALELLFLTNDDEERFSIQSHPLLLRNLLVQAAEPPLGYPLYSTGPVAVPM